MGLNTENLFVRSDRSDVVVSAVEEFVARGTLDVVRPATWPLETATDRSSRDRGYKISVSDARDGWVAVVESTEVVEPSLAVFLSLSLRTRVAITQLYEVTGSCGVAFVDQGSINGGPTRHDAPDPSEAVRVVLVNEGISFRAILFRETVGRNAMGWRTIVPRGTG